MKRLLLLNGPNINLLGKREPAIYGNQSMQNIVDTVQQTIQSYGYHLDAYQSNHEGDLIDKLQLADENYEGVIFNPAAFTHTSIGLRDVISAIDTPVIEVHLSNIHARESFRHTSLLAPVCIGQIVGLGVKGYRLAALALIENI
ncbi:type II 3-dehydroquinate dehydratase [Oceanobacillus halotolerans]|uniref:type II 3-dehydroquinate dehydratase n=1 Tax=Oceanobacillus halotolerans TaxID=2663380 RepID=UPI0013D982E6|nr:type II 3-dehydroquinate dehydratase [Oceanobacillus halotolerans]